MIPRLGHPGFRRAVIIEEQRWEILRLGRQEFIVMVESLAAGPMLKWAALRRFGQGRVIPFSEGEGFKTGVLEILCDGLRALGRHAVVAGEAHGGERMGTETDPVRIPG